MKETEKKEEMRKINKIRYHSFTYTAHYVW